MVLVKYESNVDGISWWLRLAMVLVKYESNADQGCGII